MAITVEKGVPIPIRGTGVTAAMRTLRPGDSFAMPCAEDDLRRRRRVVTQIAHTVGISIRTALIDGELRVWRAA